MTPEMLANGEGSSSSDIKAECMSVADRDTVSSCAVTLPDPLGETPQRTIKRRKMAWNCPAVGLLFQPPKKMDINKTFTHLDYRAV